MNEIYFGRRIFKDRTEEDGEDKGDHNYVSDIDLQELIGKVRFLLSDVINWQEYQETYENKRFFKNKEEKTRVYFKDGPTVIILCKIEEFDKVMELYYSGVTQFKQN